VSDHPVHGWAFLVARGRRKGYQSLLVPDFLVQSNEYGVLGQAASGDFPPEGAPRFSRINGLAAGDVTVAYLTQRLTPADLDGSPAGGSVTDEFGRPLDLLYGFVCRGADIIDLQQADFAAARAEALRTYQRFLADESGFMVESSRPFVLRSITAPAQQQQPVLEPTPVGDAAPAPYPPIPPPVPEGAAVAAPARGRPTFSPVLAAALILAVSLIAWLVLFRGDDGTVTKVSFVEPSSSKVFCTAPFTLRATVTADAATKIKYHWESNIFPPSEQLEKSIPEGDSVIETKVDLDDDADRVELTQALVVDEPNNVSGKHDYHLTCK
jgi:hypothetical protein